MTQPTRRILVAGLAAAAATPGAAIAQTGKRFDPSDPFDPRAMEADVQAYVAQGHHRTGGLGDARACAWLTELLQANGYETGKLSFPLKQFELAKASVELRGRSIEAFPVWLPRATGPAPPAGRLTLLDDDANLAGSVALFPLEAGKLHASLTAAEQRGAIAAVAVGRRAGPPVAQNAWPPFLDAETPIPCVIVGAGEGAALEVARSDGEAVRVLIEGATQPDAVGYNVLGYRRAGPSWVVVSTPYSGWFTCGGERGSGVAIWRGLAKAFAQTPLRASVVFVANSGHEVGYVGAKHTLASGSLPHAMETSTWLHLGASIGVVGQNQTAGGAWEQVDDGPRTTVQGVKVFAEHGAAAFSGLPLTRLAFDRTGDPLGELGDVVAHDYPGIGLIGGSPNFPFGHTRLDGATSVKGDYLSAIGRAAEAMVRRIQEA